MTISRVYPTELACQALRLAPTGSPAQADHGACGFCGRAITLGTPCIPAKYGQSFTDYPALVAPASHTCGWCAATVKQDPLRAVQNAVITRDGVYANGTDAARAWFWLTPPEPPFVVVFNHNTPAAFHYLWRTPVTLHRDHVIVNADDRLMTVRRPLVLRAIEVARRLGERAPQVLGMTAKNVAPLLPSPFVYLSRQPARDPRAQSLRKEVLEMAARDTQSRQDVDFLMSLGPGELFALSPFLKTKTETPAQPQLQKALKASASEQPEGAATVGA